MKHAVLFISLLISFSCASQKKEIIRKSTIKLEGKKTNIRDLLDIDGIYGKSFIFFEDGTWVESPITKNNNDRIYNFFDYDQTWIADKQIRWGVFWGVYSLQNDTIVIHCYDKGTFWKGWGLWEQRYKIIDRQTIQWIYGKGLLDIVEQYDKENNISPWKKGGNTHFTPIDIMPPSDCWLKEEKWIWRNESDWETYMQHVKQVKKQHKKE